MDTRTDLGLALRRELPGTPEEVFDAYTSAEAQRRWLSALGPDDGAVQTTVDLRVGGRWEAWFRPNPQLLVHDVQTYREIERPHRLVTDLVSESSMGGEPMPTLESHVVVTFAPTGTGTLVSVEQTGFPTTELRDFFESTAWPAGLDRLAASLAND
ncbi:SRPBCC domain-containing protein [Agromyces sp. NPDC058064]|uniref:SRPBCC family protein n=1 Tax=Agromyces sp. NPDC058064 TaxID=3346322 RepID=UPI0036D96BF2